MINPTIFRDYDIRAIIPDELDDEGIERFAQATYHHLKPKSVGIFYDARTTGKKIATMVKNLYLAAGVDIYWYGEAGTDMKSFVSGKYQHDLSIMITASHNPSEYNGFKMDRKGADSISGKSGFYPIRDLALSDKDLSLPKGKGDLTEKDIYPEWIEFCLSFVDTRKIKPLKLVVDTGNGVAGKLFSHPLLTSQIPIEIVPLYFELDGRFPNHPPNPIKEENLAELKKQVVLQKADYGVALDGDGDRITFVTDQGKFVSGSLVTAIIAESFLAKDPNQTIVYNAVCGRVVPETVRKAGGRSVRTRVGYSIIKETMRRENAVFAGEHSCHFLYRDSYYSEAAFLTFLLIAEMFSQSGKTFAEFVAPYDTYGQSGEINFQVEDKQGVMKKIAEVYEKDARNIDWLDGITVWFDTYWLNVRPSNTQPLLRLNLEADNQELLDQKTQEAIKKIEALGATRSSD
ncbi:phosphomannomutase/phosphoglucomutase [Patescibacteria group bacterium]|nr:phosphomannomutase/phosphoglucomutase [Patescibacteria group bacterium]